MRQILERLAVFIITLAIVVWGVYHLVFYTKKTVTTETVFTETISRSLGGEGIAVREEENLINEGSGAQRFLYSDATRVGVGQAVAEYYSGDVKNRNVQNIREYEEKIEMLKLAQNKNLNNFSTVSIIGRDIREQLALLADIGATGDCDDLSLLRSDLAFLVNRRQVATGKVDSFQEKIDLLTAEAAALKSSADIENISQAYTPKSGYFAKRSDGYETIISPEKLDEVDINTIVNLIDEDNSASSIPNSGRIVTDSQWYFAVYVPVHLTEWVKVGQTATLVFNHITEHVPVKVSRLIIENNNDDAVIIFTSDYISEEIVNLRKASVTVNFSQFTGLKINSSSLRFKENTDGETVMGVYVLENYVVKFRTIDPIYEEQSFVLSRTNHVNSSDKNNVRLYDQVIVEGGTDIEEGKIIQ